MQTIYRFNPRKHFIDPYSRPHVNCKQILHIDSALFLFLFRLALLFFLRCCIYALAVVVPFILLSKVSVFILLRLIVKNLTNKHVFHGNCFAQSVGSALFILISVY